jgi:hypothetical protein
MSFLVHGKVCPVSELLLALSTFIGLLPLVNELVAIKF